MRPSSLELNFNQSGDLLIQRVRSLAKTSYWQTLYSCAKELKFRLFLNDIDFSELQLLFLNYLGFYGALNMDIAIGDVPEIVLKDEIYEDAYMYYKNKSDKKKFSENKNQRSSALPEESSPQVNWVFKKPKKA